MVTEDRTEATSPLNDAMENIQRELVRRVAADDRDSNRNVYDALKNECEISTTPWIYIFPEHRGPYAERNGRCRFKRSLDDAR